MKKLNKYIDHTLLKAPSKELDIIKLCSEAKYYNFKSVCVNPCFVKLAKNQLEGSDVLVCTVVGFPLGASTKAVKSFETVDAINNGADEIDMVINIGKAKEHDYQYIEEEIKSVVKAAAGKTVKVILETCYLTSDEIVACSKAASHAKANFVKTSTGFGTYGARVEDVKLMKESINKSMEVKASGGVRNYADAISMIEAGATRIGASSGAAILEEMKSKENE